MDTSLFLHSASRQLNTICFEIMQLCKSSSSHNPCPNDRVSTWRSVGCCDVTVRRDRSLWWMPKAERKQGTPLCAALSHLLLLIRLAAVLCLAHCVDDLFICLVVITYWGLGLFESLTTSLFSPSQPEKKATPPLPPSITLSLALSLSLLPMLFEVEMMCMFERQTTPTM